MRLVLVIAFLLVPLAELAVIIQVQQAIGLDWTLVALLAISIVGAVLVKREGVKAWTRFREALGDGRLPTEEVVDGALVLLAGALLLTPGFLTDGVGFAFLIPVSRRLANRGLRSRARFAMGLGPAASGPGRRGDEPGTVDVEVVDVRRNEPRNGGEALDSGDRPGEG